VSDFENADIDDLLKVEKPEKSEYDEAYEALLQDDRKMMHECAQRENSRIHWPEPVTKRHIR